MTPFAELVAASDFSFLRGVSSGAALVVRALALGLAGLGIADRNTVAGVVRAHAALRELREHETPAVAEAARRFRLVVGARLAFADGTPDIVVLPERRDGWGRLCRLLTIGNRRAKKGACRLGLDDLLAETKHQLLIVVPERDLAPLPALLTRLEAAAPGAVRLAAVSPA